MLGAIQRTLSKNSKLLNGSDDTNDQNTHETLGEALLKSSNVCAQNALKQNCSICSPDYLPDNSCTQSTDEPSRDSNDESSMALVPVEKLEAASSSISQLIKELPEVRPGWPLLRRAVFSNRQATNGSSVQQISVVQWALRLPSRHPLSVEDLDKKGVSSDDKNNAFKLDGESGAIVPFNNENISHPSSPEKSGSVPEELVCLHEKYAATCRLFKYQELLSATLDFSSGLVFYSFRLNARF